MAKVRDIKSGKEVEPKTEIRYSDNPDFLGEAFSLFCKGMNCCAIANAMRPEWPEASERTVQRIAKEMGWEKSRASFLKFYMDAAASAEGLMPNIVLSLERLRAKLESQGIKKASDVFAYARLCDDLLWYTGKHPKLKADGSLAISTDEQTRALLEALQEDEVIGAAWKRRRSKIQMAYKQKLADSGVNTKAGEGARAPRTKR